MQCSSIPGEFTPAALPWAAHSPHHPAPQPGSSPATALQGLKEFFSLLHPAGKQLDDALSSHHASMPGSAPSTSPRAPLGTMGSSQVPKALLGLPSLSHGAFNPNRAKHSAMALGAVWGKVRRHFPPRRGLELEGLVGASPSDITTLSSLGSAVCTGQEITQSQGSGAGRHPGMILTTSPSQAAEQDLSLPAGDIFPTLRVNPDWGSRMLLRVPKAKGTISCWRPVPLPRSPWDGAEYHPSAS